MLLFTNAEEDYFIGLNRHICSYNIKKNPKQKNLS